MITRSLRFAFAVSLVLVVGCSKDEGAAPAGSGAPATGAPPTKAGGGSAKSGSAAAAFPATAIPAKNLADFTIGLPPGAKITATPEGDRTTIESSDYRLIIKTTDKPADTDGMKGMLKGMKTFKGFTVDQADGLVAEMDEPSGKQFVLTRVVSVGDKKISCESAMTSPPKTAEKAKEAFDVCGSIAKK